MMQRTRDLAMAGLILCFGQAGAQDNDELLARGEALFHADVGCAVCHAPTGEGLVGPSLHFGPTPVDIFDQLESNPVMGIIVEEMNPSDDDLVALSMYIRTLAGLPLEDGLRDSWLTALASARANRPAPLDFPSSEWDLRVEAVERYAALQASWTRKAREGSRAGHYDAQVVAEWDPGEPKFTPEPGKTYWYENVGTTSSPSVLFEGYRPPTRNRLVVGDAGTKKIIASYEIPENLRATVHTSMLSPDGRFAYIVGPRIGQEDGRENYTAAATLIKLDAITLQPIKAIDIGGRIHHGQAFGDVLLLDMFGRAPNGLAIQLLDPQTDEILGGITDEDLGGRAYTVWTDRDYEYIYATVEPVGNYRSGYAATQMMYQGKLMAIRPFWIAKIDPETWTVVKEYPVPGYRPNWIVVDSAKEHLYVVNTMGNASKINIVTGAVVWTHGTGIGPYGGTLNADETEFWVADKGEGTHHLGRTITVMDAETGVGKATLFGAYKTDHVLLAPNGREMWATSNGEGRILVFDAQTKELTHRIDMPGNGDAHGLVWVHYDENGVGRVVRDQGNFHNGVSPALGRPLSY